MFVVVVPDCVGVGFGVKRVVLQPAAFCVCAPTRGFVLRVFPGGGAHGLLCWICNLARRHWWRLPGTGLPSYSLLQFLSEVPR